MPDILDEFDPFQFDSGFKDDYIGTIIDAWFATDTTYNSTNLHVKVKAEDGEEIENRYSCGNEWASFDGGKTVEHPSKKTFNKQTGYASFCLKALSSGAEEELRSRSKELGGPRSAELWLGLSFHWAVEESSYKFKDRETGEQKEGTSYRSFPDSFVGIGGVQGAMMDVANAASREETDDLGLTSTLRGQIAAIAKDQPYHDWVDSVMALPGVTSNGNLIRALGDESFYQTLREG